MLLLDINLHKAQRVLWVVTAILILLGTQAAYFKFILGYATAYYFVPKFYLDAEANIPTYFSTCLLLIASSLFYIIYRYKKQNNDPFTKHWLCLGLLFFFMSVDEATALHDVLSGYIRFIFKLNGAYYFAWVVVGLVSVILFIFLFLRFLFLLPTRFKYRFILAAVIYIGGALGFEMLGSYYRTTVPAENMTYAAITIAEEALEMIGILILINTLVIYMKPIIPRIAIAFVEKIALENKNFKITKE